MYSYLVLNQVVYCDVVHHIEELKDNWDLRINEDNLIPLSNSIHGIIHAEYLKSNESKKKMQDLLRELLNCGSLF